MTVPTAADRWLLERLRYWQERLRLQDWEIRAFFVSRAEMDARARPYSMAHVRMESSPLGGALIDYSPSRRYAEIAVLAPGSDENVWPPMTMEEWILHEMLHVLLCDWACPPCSLEERAQERVIDALVGILLPRPSHPLP